MKEAFEPPPQPQFIWSLKHYPSAITPPPPPLGECWGGQLPLGPLGHTLHALPRPPPSPSELVRTTQSIVSATLRIVELGSPVFWWSVKIKFVLWFRAWDGISAGALQTATQQQSFSPTKAHSLRRIEHASYSAQAPAQAMQDNGDQGPKFASSGHTSEWHTNLFH